MNIKAVIFDMDGVLVDSEPLHFQADKKLFAFYNKNFSEKEQVEFTGRRVLEQIKALKTRWNIPAEVDFLIVRRQKIFQDLVDTQLSLVAGAKDLIEFLGRNNIPLAIATSAEDWYAALVLDIFNLESFFRVVVTSKDVKRGKPAPDIYQVAAKLLGVDAGSCLVLEDAPSGVASAKSAGMACYAIPSQYTKNMDFSSADRVFETLRDIKENIEL